MNAHFECSVMYDEVNAAAFTFCLIENICGSWYNVGDHVSDFGEISYPLSTIEYEYTSCVLESTTDDSGVHKSSTSIDGLNSIGCRREMKHYNRSVLWKYGCPGSSRYAKKCAGLIGKHTQKHKCVNQLSIAKNLPLSNHLLDASLCWLPNVFLGCILTSECVIALLNIFSDPSYIFSICFAASVRIVFFVMKRLMELCSGIMWGVLLGKYSEPNKHRLRPLLIMIALSVCSLRPFFVVSTSECPFTDAGKVEHIFKLPVQSESLLEHAKRLRAEYDVIQQQRRCKRERERYDRKCRRERYGVKRAKNIQKQIQYNMAHRDDHNKRQVEYNMAHRADHNKRQVKYNEAQRGRSNQRTTEDHPINELESFLRFLDADYREKLERMHIERIDELLQATAVGGDINKQRANVCVCCDQIIFGFEPVKQLKKGQLLENSTRLCVSQYEQHFGIQLHPELVQQYQVRILFVLVVVIP